MRWLLTLLSISLMVPFAPAAVKTRSIEYKHGDVQLEGYLAYDDATTEKRPGVLVVHDWTGHNAYARKRAEQLAALGYVAFALDMYGKGVLAKDAKDAKEAAQLASVFKKDRTLMRARAAAGLDVLRQQAQTDSARIGAMGYCFGGTTALELARSAADLKGTVAFHANLDTPQAQDARQIKGKILVLHGADDPIVSPAEVSAFVEEMRKAGVDWQLNSYGSAVHSFTNPAAGDDPSKGTAYNANADHRSFDAMQSFWKEVFKSAAK